MSLKDHLASNHCVGFIVLRANVPVRVVSWYELTGAGYSLYLICTSSANFWVGSRTENTILHIMIVVHYFQITSGGIRNEDIIAMYSSRKQHIYCVCAIKCRLRSRILTSNSSRYHLQKTTEF